MLTSETDLQKIRSISAQGGLAYWQKGALFLLMLIFVTSFILNPVFTLASFVTLFIFGMAVNVGFKVYVMCQSGGGVTAFETLLSDEECPFYTVLVAVRGEANILSQLVRNLSNQDYPHHKLQVILIVDEDDEITCHAASTLWKPPYVDVVIVPDSWEGPRGKPRALNYVAKRGYITGEFVVVYDGEDNPESDQLRKAATAFRLYPDIDCFQAVLRWWNEDRNWYTRMVAVSYSINFNLMLRGLAATGSVFPLGGTSNHIRADVLRALDFWDEYNVTEDLGLGASLALAGCRCLVLHSTTWEEATTTFYKQVKQTSRWIKGHTATAIAFTRDPIFLVRKMGPKKMLSFFSVVFVAHPAMLAAPAFWGMTVIFALSGAKIIQEITPTYAFYVGTLCLLTNGVFMWTAGIALLRARQFRLWPWIWTLPFYWASILTIAAFKAAREVLTGRLYYWDKTAHGLDTQEQEVLTQIPTGRLVPVDE